MNELNNLRRLEAPAESAADIVAKQLRERIIGQDEAIETIRGAYDKARLRQEGRPVASLMFTGPTGTGKTETAETLCSTLAADKLHPPLIRIDCAQYANGHEVAALVGSPPGYVGREQQPLLDKDIIETAGSVVLFDEIEKGHPKLWNYLLQIMEGKGVRLLSTGETVSFNNCTVIMTSNVGAREMESLMDGKRIGFASPDFTKPQKMEGVALNALKKQFAPEFINRLDATVTFRSLDDSQLEDVLSAHVKRSNSRYERLANISLDLSDEVRREVVATSENRREFNARPVLRNYERMVEAPLSRLVTGDKVGGNIIRAELDEGEVVFYEGALLPTVMEILSIESGEYEEVDEPVCEDDEKQLEKSS